MFPYTHPFFTPTDSSENFEVLYIQAKHLSDYAELIKRTELSANEELENMLANFYIEIFNACKRSLMAKDFSFNLFQVYFTQLVGFVEIHSHHKRTTNQLLADIYFSLLKSYTDDPLFLNKTLNNLIHHIADLNEFLTVLRDHMQNELLIAVPDHMQQKKIDYRKFFLYSLTVLKEACPESKAILNQHITFIILDYYKNNTDDNLKKFLMLKIKDEFSFIATINTLYNTFKSWDLKFLIDLLQLNYLEILFKNANNINSITKVFSYLHKHGILERYGVKIKLDYTRIKSLAEQLNRVTIRNREMLEEALLPYTIKKEKFGIISLGEGIDTEFIFPFTPSFLTFADEVKPFPHYPFSHKEPEPTSQITTEAKKTSPKQKDELKPSISELLKNFGLCTNSTPSTSNRKKRKQDQITESPRKKI